MLFLPSDAAYGVHYIEKDEIMYHRTDATKQYAKPKLDSIYLYATQFPYK